MTILMALWIKISIGFIVAIFVFLFLRMIAEQEYMGDEMLRYQTLKEELAEIRKQLESKSTPPTLRTQLMRRMDEVWKEMVRIQASMPRHSDHQQGNYKLK